MSTASLALSAWIGFPVVLGLLSLGLGLLVEAVVRRALPRAVLPVLGFALLVVIGQAITAIPATAQLSMPLVVALALAGLFVGRSALAMARSRLALLLVPAVA